MRHFGGDRAAREKPGDQGPVTAADLEVDRVLETMLRTARPDYGWLSEESEDDPSRLNAQRVFVIDPIDGTRAFIEGGKAWGHSLAVVEDGRPVTAVVHVPRLGQIYSAQAGRGVSCNGMSIRATRPRSPIQARILLSANQLDPRFWPGGVPEIERHFRSSIAYRLCLVAEGRFDGMISFRDTWEWDIAAGALIAQEAGAEVSDRYGETLAFNRKFPVSSGIIVAAPKLHAEFVERATAPET